MQAHSKQPRPVTRKRPGGSNGAPFGSLPIWLAILALGAASALTILDRRGPPVTELGAAMGGEVTTSALPGTV